MVMRKAFEIGGERVPAGTRRLVDLPVSRLSNHTPVTLPVHVLHGHEPGPAMFVSAAIHGDELNGVEIIRRLLRTLGPGSIQGTLLCCPIVNAYGFIGRSRYLPDRRDLNRSFPGSPNGSLAARLAHLFLNEVVKRCEIGIDLHTAAVHRVNLPQLRARFAGNARTRELGEAFGVQVMLEAPERPGSLRRAAREAGVEVLVYEGGEGLRFDEFAIRAGADGILGVMHKATMIVTPDGMAPTMPPGGAGMGGGSFGHGSGAARPTVLANASKWVRAPEGGVLRSPKRIGEAVGENEVIGAVANPYEDTETPIRSPRRGIIIGRTTLPVVNMGDALFHVAWSDDFGRARPSAEIARDADPLMDEDEII